MNRFTTVPKVPAEKSESLTSPTSPKVLTIPPTSEKRLPHTASCRSTSSSIVRASALAAVIVSVIIILVSDLDSPFRPISKYYLIHLSLSVPTQSILNPTDYPEPLFV
ncbi:uncharacterized protein ACHE_20645S [Aspergillus chevalieri]|uniref:Uncharacterized protein n=1 Tax=Aspergillus chevalieri TaxID=182096 RepID=A0A7R7ZLJ4_ASPCH|nr:uncharacterized protein ACHE_20645S [Aspergillus chevalieri]BCR85187.1 hypothetical protein ACHE_20645S [Aspergillus chevalieri]